MQLYRTLPPIQQGILVCVLLANALVVVTTDGVIVAAVIHGAMRTWRHRRLGPVAAPRAGITPVLCGAMAASAIHRVVVQGLFRAVDSGRAAAWLERGERWLTAGAEDQNESQ